MKKFIRIQSEIDIQVTGGLQSINLTNKDAHVADRLAVQSAWSGQKVLIRKGMGFYPCEIKNWNSVKALAKSGVLTLGEEVDDTGSEETNNKVEALKKALANDAAKTAKTIAGAQEDRSRRVAVRKEEADADAAAEGIKGPSF